MKLHKTIKCVKAEKSKLQKKSEKYLKEIRERSERIKNPETMPESCLLETGYIEIEKQEGCKNGKNKRILPCL